MDNYFEQNVTGPRGAQERLMYMLCWVGIVVFGVVVLFSAANIFSADPENPGIHWQMIPIAVVAAAVTVLLYRSKDKVFCEYDYILWNSEIEVHAVYNLSSRKKLSVIPLDRVTAWGPASAMERQMNGAKKHVWYVRKDGAWCLIYPGDHGTEAALLELSDEMRAQLRTTVPVLRSLEVKP